MLETGWFFLLAIIALFLVGGALAYALRVQRKLTPAQRHDLDEAMDGEVSDEEADDGCPVRVEPVRARERRRRGAQGQIWREGTRSIG